MLLATGETWRKLNAREKKALRALEKVAAKDRKGALRRAKGKLVPVVKKGLAFAARKGRYGRKSY